MPDVDDLLRDAFRPDDDPWAVETRAALGAVVRRHRRRTMTRRGLAAGTLVATAAAVMALVVQDATGPRGVEPAAPSPMPSASTTPIEGRWTSGPLGTSDVRAAARAADAPGAAATMLTDLPRAPFRVVAVIRGTGLTTYVEGRGGRRELLDEESVAVEGDLLILRPRTLSAETVHAWSVVGDELTLDFRSTTEGENDIGVPGEAWQRLLYDTVPFTR
ncbi:hypothetical protein SAMN05192575_106101 [Nocardioides alpinus]|uniref:Uncharacterized protein n=1 Tax=Nocardioides alpinus TaxID=748909 RepID=A0A1I0ZQ09_9ACTN|nr:hypothetical protein [Nocardioides alpinus]PKH41910.1 hypothetical protein CXG46_08640 [Nocardioides alpinus]SFB27196.1 hypothetical protein SAMN05192575_106101 [Nocardioides alpinus]